MSLRDLDERDATVAHVCAALRALAKQTTGSKGQALASAAWFDPALRAARATQPLGRYGEDSWQYTLRAWPQLLDETDLSEPYRGRAAEFPATYGKAVAAFAILVQRAKYETEYAIQFVRYMARRTRLALEHELIDFAGRLSKSLPGSPDTLLGLFEQLNTVILQGEPYDTLRETVVGYVGTTMDHIGRLHTLDAEAKGRKRPEARPTLGRVAFRVAGALVTAHRRLQLVPEDVATALVVAGWTPPAHLKKLIENEARHWTRVPVTDETLPRILLDTYAGRLSRSEYRR